MLFSIVSRMYERRVFEDNGPTLACIYRRLPYDEFTYMRTASLSPVCRILREFKNIETEPSLSFRIRPQRTEEITHARWQHGATHPTVAKS